jgi:hypothetical protein
MHKLDFLLFIILAFSASVFQTLFCPQYLFTCFVRFLEQTSVNFLRRCVIEAVCFLWCRNCLCLCHTAVFVSVSVMFNNSSFFDYNLFLSYDSQGQNWLHVYPQTSLKVDVSARRSKALVCGRSFYGIGVPNPTRRMVVSVLWELAVVRQSSVCRADHSSRGILLSVVFLNMISKPLKWRIPGPLDLVTYTKKKASTDCCW